MSNKFLELYPQLREPRIGDRIRMIETLDHVYKKGDIGIIKAINFVTFMNHNAYYTQFINSNNNNDYAWVYREEIELVGYEEG
jgi:hypothetical protein